MVCTCFTVCSEWVTNEWLFVWVLSRPVLWCSFWLAEQAEEVEVALWRFGNISNVLQFAKLSNRSQSAWQFLKLNKYYKSWKMFSIRARLLFSAKLADVTKPETCVTQCDVWCALRDRWRDAGHGDNLTILMTGPRLRSWQLWSMVQMFTSKMSNRSFCCVAYTGHTF